MSEFNDREHDRSLAHPIEELRDVAELTRVLTRLAVAWEAAAQRQTQFEDLLRSHLVNNVLWSGAAQVDATTYQWKKSGFQAPFAAVTVSDPNGIGPIRITGGDDLTDTEVPGIGRWKVQKNGREVFAITHTSLTFQASASGIFYVTVWGVNQGIS